MTVNQTINHINENNYDVDIEISGIPSGLFPAVTSNQISAGSTTREIGVMLLPLEQSPGETMSCNSGLFVKQNGETSVSVKVSKDGQEVASNTTSY